MSSYLREMMTMVSRGRNVFIADTARVLGQVDLSDHVSVWYGAVIRGDFDTISIGARSNIQEGVCIHVDEGCPVSLGEDNVVGHGAILHGCTIGNSTLIGMRATIMNGAVIGSGCIVGAHALVTEGMNIPDHSLVLGSPARIIKTLPASAAARTLEGVQHYLDEARKYLESEGSYT